MCETTLKTFESHACICPSLRSFSLHLEAIPVDHVFLSQGGGRGDEVAEGQLCEGGGRTKSLKTARV